MNISSDINDKFGENRNSICHPLSDVKQIILQSNFSTALNKMSMPTRTTGLPVQSKLNKDPNFLALLAFVRQTLSKVQETSPTANSIILPLNN